MVGPGLNVCPLLAEKDGGQCLSLARRRREFAAAYPIRTHTPLKKREIELTQFRLGNWERKWFSQLLLHALNT